MPIDSHIDFFELAKSEKAIGRQIRAIAAQEKRIQEVRDKLALQLDELVKVKNQAAEAMKELAKRVSELALTKSENSGVDKSKLDPADTDLFNDEAAQLEEEAKTHTTLSDALKDLSYQVKNTVEKIDAYGVGFEILGKCRDEFTKADKVLFEKKDKLTDKRGGMEGAKTAADRNFEQAKKDIARRKEEYLKELEKLQEKNAVVAEKWAPAEAPKSSSKKSSKSSDE